MRIRCYYRTSSEEQSDNWSIDAQDRACRNFIAAHPGWQLAGQPYVDEAWSGRTVHRPAFQQMMQDARDGQFDALVCHKLDRFSRSLVDVLLSLDELQKCNVVFASTAETMDFTTPDGRAMLMMLARFAEWYLQNMSDEMTKGKRARFEAGYWNGDLRFGYSKIEAGEEMKNGMAKKLYRSIPNDDAKYVVMAYELCAAGKIDQVVADELNGAGSRTYRLISNPKAKAGPEIDVLLRRGWVKDSVTALFSREAAQFYLGNAMYVGEKERKKSECDQQIEIRQGMHEAIINWSLYERAMAARSVRRNPGRLYSAQSKRVYLLGEGIAHCASCGKPLRSVYGSKGPKGGHYLYYRCAAWLRDERCNASRQQVREDIIEPQLDAYIAALVLPEGWRKRLKQQIESVSQTDNLLKRRENLRGQLRRLNHQFEHGLIEKVDVPAYEKHAQQLIREINGMVVSDTQYTLERCEQLLAFSLTWATADRFHRHAIVKEIIEAVYVDTGTRSIIGIKPHAEFVPLFRQTKLMERDSCFALEKNETAQ